MMMVAPAFDSYLTLTHVTLPHFSIILFTLITRLLKYLYLLQAHSQSEMTFHYKQNSYFQVS